VLFRQMVQNVYLEKCHFVNWYKMCFW